VLDGPSRVEAPFEPPFDPAEVERFLRGLAARAESHRSGAQAATREVRGPAAQPTIYEALFRGRIRDTFQQCLAQQRAQPGSRLRLRLVFGLGAGKPDQVAALPWELLCPPDSRNFLVLGEEVRLVRELHVEAGRSRQPLSDKFRVLVVSAQPEDLDPLNLNREWNDLERELEGSSQLELAHFAGASIEELREKLEGGRFNGLHFMGHGSFDPENGTGHLLFDQHGISHPVSGELLATNLRDLPHLQLTVLNACHSGATAGDANFDPYLGVASALLRGGQTAVVAMQTAIPDDAAIAFSQGFYRAMGKGRGIERAQYEGRLRVLNRLGEHSAAWAIPTLFVAPGSVLSRQTDPTAIPTNKPVELTPPSSLLPERKKAGTPRRFFAFAAAVLLVLGLTWGLSLARDYFQKEPIDPGPPLGGDKNVTDVTNGDTTADPPPQTQPTQLTEPAIQMSEPKKTTTQPPVPQIQYEKIVAGRVGIALLDSSTGQFSKELTGLALQVVGIGSPSSNPVRLQLDTGTIEDLTLGDYSSLPGGDKAPGGVEWILVGTATVGNSSNTRPNLQGAKLTVNAVLISTSTKRVETRISEPNTGLAISHSAALTQALERCLSAAVDRLEQGEIQNAE